MISHSPTSTRCAAMVSPPVLRLFLALALALVLLLGLVLALNLLESALAVRQHLAEISPWLPPVFLTGLVLFFLGVGLAVRRILRPRARPTPPPAAAPLPVIDEGEVETRIARNAALGAEADTARRELEEVRARRKGGEFHISVAGEINMGKSSLVTALIPEAWAAIAPIGGSTRSVTRQVWTTPGGDRIVLADLPGLGEVGGILEEEARAEAIRSHGVLYLCDGDLTRAQLQEVQALAELGKPLVVVLNKADRFSADELSLLRQRLQERLAEIAGGRSLPVVTARAGGSRVVVRRLPDGREVEETRPRPPEVDEVRRALQGILDGDRALLERMRDRAVFAMVARQLDGALAAHRRTRGEEIVVQHARRAMVAAGAAVTPGMDLIFQGVVGISMMRELCALHGVGLSGVSLEGVLQKLAVQGSRSLALLLAVVGNGLKAFPGLGTLAGGAVHAVAYGILVQALGRAVVVVLEERGGLVEGPLLAEFKERVGEDVERQMVEMAKMFMEIKGGKQ